MLSAGDKLRNKTWWFPQELLGLHGRKYERHREAKEIKTQWDQLPGKNVQKAVGPKSGSGWKVRWNAGGEETAGWENKGIPQM